MRSGVRGARGALLLLVIPATLASLVSVAPAVLASPGPTISAESYPVVQGSSAPLGDIAIDESAVGQLTAGDVITFRFTDASSAATFHLSGAPVASGTLGLSATAAIASTSGVLKDEVVVTVAAPSTGSFPGVLTVTGLQAGVDVAAASGPNVVRISDTSSILASSVSPATTSDANAIGSSPAAGYAAKSTPGIDSTGKNMPGGDLTITEPSKLFFKTGDVITFTIRDSVGSRDTVGLAGPPTASGGGMVVSVLGLNGATVQPNDTGFKVSIDEQDPSNGSSSAIKVSNILFNTALAPSGKIQIAAKVTTGSGTEYIYPGRVADALVGGGTTTSSAGQPVVATGSSAQPVGNLVVSEVAGSLKPSTTFSIAIQEPGVTFSSAPFAVVTAGNLRLVSETPAIDWTKTIATWTVAARSTEPTTIVVAPIEYDVSASGPGAGDAVNVVASGSGGSAFTTQTVSNALIAPTGKTLFTAGSAPATPQAAGGVIYQEVAGGRAPTGGSIVLLSPFPTQLLSYRATFASVPTATVNNPGSGLVLGAGTINSGPVTVETSTGSFTARAETAAIFPVTTGSTTAASVTFSNISYAVGADVPPGALVATGAVDTGAGGTGSNVSGNQFANAFNPLPPGWGVDPPPPPPPPATYRPDLLIKLASSTSFLGDDIYGTTTGQTVSKGVAPGKRFTVAIEVQNDGSTTDSITLKGTGNRKGFTVSYLDGLSGTTNITSQVEAGTFATSIVGAGSSVFMRLVISAKSLALVGTKGSWTVTAASVANGAKTDLVLAKAKVT